MTSTQDPVAQRYRDPELTSLPLRSDTIDLQLAHRSVRAFLDTPVGDDALTAIVAAAQSASTSSNLQAWSVIAVRDPRRRERLAHLVGDQSAVRQAPLLLVWLADLGRATRIAARSNEPLDAPEYLESTILGFVDAALAAQNASLAAESLGLGTVFIGAVRNHPDKIAEELALPDRVFAAFGLAVGVPDPDEAAGVKPRLPQAAVLHHEVYDTAADAAIDDYDERLASYNAEYRREGGWVSPVLARLRDRDSLKGRHLLRDHLTRRGLPSH
ncbi:NADPH-dependent oxidoreductase [Tsukamurella sp. 8F]|uniref:NADPH-dependent oxidoreductase n=1 Tax=unclassified Tsukamurella TaxID=2633480 RepID=UPI0023B898DB|nr:MULTISPECIES: NADPH-dependent oxidoreductase [unclassified Tsukamurella]MDF0529743.1 NADPH-dependent oxidoreductase [Tsukamurella sp. 8J]MDF0586028.1 NADPH-dependent oxidoreductase [Tsukamurella sp. 8F]